VHENEVERVSAIDIDADRLFREFVARRKPVVLKGLVCGDLAAVASWSDGFLAEHVGDETVQVEVRDVDSGEGFGKGKKRKMAFREFVSKLQEGDESMYLTTQETASDGTLLTTPLAQLRKKVPDAFPLRPKLMGNLVPAAINLWMGHSRSGTSSGLHHDFHDNLYILIRGKKKFKLFSPADAAFMYTAGQISHVHENGRINYEGGETKPDGSSIEVERQLASAKARVEAEDELAAAEEAEQKSEPGAKQRREKAEERLDDLLLAQLNGNDFDIRDDYAESEEEGESEPDRKKRRKEEVLPQSFSKVQSTSNVERDFPLFKKARSMDVVLEANEMLFLPCGWFHEVTSISSKEASQHLALNFWFHPPDQYKDVRKPYQDHIWEEFFLLNQ